jgi:ATP-dependent DNA helicase HFM1/MER3
MRFLAVSATIPNTEDIACWLGESPDYSARFYKINEEMRPVKLQKIVMCYPHPAGASQFHFEMSLSYKLRAILFKYADGKPTLIFCSTRKGVEHTCSTLTQQITFHFTKGQKERLSEVATTLNDNKLRQCVMAGVGYHHAGMGKEDRQVMN